MRIDTLFLLYKFDYDIAKTHNWDDKNPIIDSYNFYTKYIDYNCINCGAMLIESLDKRNYTIMPYNITCNELMMINIF